MSDNEPVECGDLGAPPCDHLFLRDAKGSQATCVRCGEKRSMGEIEHLSNPVAMGSNGHGPGHVDMEALCKVHDNVDCAWGRLSEVLDGIAQGQGLDEN